MKPGVIQIGKFITTLFLVTRESLLLLVLLWLNLQNQMELSAGKFIIIHLLMLYLAGEALSLQVI